MNNIIIIIIHHNDYPKSLTHKWVHYRIDETVRHCQPMEDEIAIYLNIVLLFRTEPDNVEFDQKLIQLYRHPTYTIEYDDNQYYFYSLSVIIFVLCFFMIMKRMKIFKFGIKEKKKEKKEILLLLCNSFFL